VLGLGYGYGLRLGLGNGKRQNEKRRGVPSPVVGCEAAREVCVIVYMHVFVSSLVLSYASTPQMVTLITLY